jgi:hypothetical protein
MLGQRHWLPYPAEIPGGASGGGAVPVVTVATVTSANSPYAVLVTDNLVLFDESNGLRATATLPTAPTVGRTITFKWWNYTLGAPPPVIQGNGKMIEAWDNPVGAPGLAGSSVISTQGGQGTWEYDGVEWVLTSV